MNYPYYDKRSINKVVKILESGKVNYWTGNECKKFEKDFSKYLNNKYSISLSNGSVALELSLKALDLKKGDEIVVSPRSFIISASCVLNLGLKPIFADVDHNGNLSINGISKVFNKRVKAIIVVHLNGMPCDLDPIIKFVKKNNLFLIEDCSQAHGAIYKGKKVGSFGHLSTWSFCQDKIISTGGEGGMVSTNSKKLWTKIWSLKDHGKNYKSVFYKKHKIGFKWLHDFSGSNYRMTEIQAAIGRQQLKTLDRQIKKRNLIASIYLNELKNYYTKFSFLQKPVFKCISCPLKEYKKKCNKCTHSFYRLNLFIDKNYIDQNELIKRLHAKKINCGVGSCPEIYKEKIFGKFNLFQKKRLSNAKLLGEISLTFPINPYQDIDKIKFDIRIIKKIFDQYI